MGQIPAAGPTSGEKSEARNVEACYKIRWMPIVYLSHIGVWVFSSFWTYDVEQILYINSLISV